MTALNHPQAWSDDRLHLTPAGHHRVALRTAEVLGLPVDEDWQTPWPVSSEPAWLARRRAGREVDPGSTSCRGWGAI